MRIPFASSIALLLLGLAGPAASQTVVPVAKFEGIELRGGGRVILRHGPVQRVTITRGSREFSSFELGRRETRADGRVVIDNRESLVIRACNRRCPDNYRLEVEIVTPVAIALSVSGGGEILTGGSHPRQDNIAVAVNGGGSIDARALPANNVAASVSGGGNLLVRAESALAASINGGGTIRYWGNPAVSRWVRGGGSVLQAR
jgi:hypothetical protein